MLVEDFRDFFDRFENAFGVADYPRFKKEMSVRIKENDKVEFKGGKLYISKEGSGSTLIVGCDSWKKVIDAVAKGVLEETRAKNKEKQEKEFVSSLVEEIDTLLENTPDDNVLQIALSEEAYDLLKQYNASVYVSWKARFKIKRKNVYVGSNERPLSYKIWVEDVGSGEATSFQGYAGFVFNEANADINIGGCEDK